MSDTSYRSSARDAAADPPSQPTPSPGLFRTWLRNALRGKAESSWRETIEDLIEEQGEAQPDVAAHERVLLTNILRLRDITAHDVMVPRVDIVALDIETAVPEVLKQLAEHSHSRVPVYRETLDDVVGILHLKDVLTAVLANKDAKLADMVRDATIVAPSVRVLDLLNQMREKRQHMALVVDEFGGIDGLITIEDLVEQIVGEIEDEHDIQEAPQLIERPDGSVVANSRLPIEDFEARFGAVLGEAERESVDTLGGLIFSLAGRIPVRGEVLRHPSGLEFEVLDADPRRVRRVRVRPPQRPAAAETGGG